MKSASLDPILKADYLEIQGDFFDVYLGLPESEYKLDYAAFQPPDSTTPIDHFGKAYFLSSLGDYSINLINLLNQFATGINRIEAWGVVFEDRERGVPDRLYILASFLNPQIMAWIAAPYVFQQRIGVCTISLLNDYAVIGDRTIHQIDEDKFRFNWFDSKKWKKYASDCGVDIGALKEAYLKLGNTSTAQLRHEFVHRYPPNFGYGSSKMFIRSKEGKSIALSGNSAVPISSVVRDLTEESKLAKEAFLAFWDQFEPIAKILAV